jgi:hypothetical protein
MVYSGQGTIITVVLTMIRLGKALTLVSLLLCATVPVVAWYPSPRSLNAKRVEAVKRWETSARRAAGGNARRAAETSTSSRVKNITFSNPKASGAFARVRVHGASFVIFSHCVQSSTWMVQAFPK